MRTCYYLHKKDTTYQFFVINDCEYSSEKSKEKPAVQEKMTNTPQTINTYNKLQPELFFYLFASEHSTGK